MNRLLHRFAVGVFLVGVIIYSFLGLIPPEPSPESEQMGVFSVQKVYTHLQKIASEPHPTGSEGNDRVREYILSASKELGYHPVVQTANVIISAENRNLITSATIHNILIRVSGSSPSKALLVTAHYDSEAGSYGANDDGVAVASMLETLRVLKEKGKLKNDVIFLFTDGEELDLLGARAFWQEHAWAKDVGMVLNYEARGSSGPSLMFETGENNGWMIEQFSDAASHPVTNSSMSEFYQLMTNNTDFTIAKQFGITGLNFAYGDGRYTYHTPLDNVEHVDLRTALHQGKNIYNSVMHYGNTDLVDIHQEDKVFYNIAGKLVHYPKSWVIPLSCLISFFIVYGMVWRVMKKRLQILRLGLAMITVAAALSFIYAAILGVWKLVGLFAVDVMLRYQINLISIALTVLTLILFIFSYRISTRWVNADHLYSAILVYNVVLLWVTSVYLPGASYLLVWPFIIHYLLYFWTMNSTKPIDFYILPNGLSSGLCLLFFVPTLYLLIVFMPINYLPYSFAGVGLVAFWVFSSFSFLNQRNSKYVQAGLSILCLIGFMLFYYNVKSNAEIPHQNNLFFVQHSNQEKSFWVSKTEPDEWTVNAMPNPEKRDLNEMIIFNGSKQAVWVNQASNQSLPSPAVTVLKNEKRSDSREIELHIQSGRKAQEYLMLEVIDAQVLMAEVEGKHPDYSGATEEKWNWRMRHYNVPEEGLHVKLVIKGTERVSLRVMDGTFGLPEGMPDRTKNMMGRYEYDQMSLVLKNFLLDE